MFYIYADGKSIYQPLSSDMVLLSPKLTLEMGKAGSLQFQIPPTHKYYNMLFQLSTIVTVEMDDVEIFRGRVLTNNRNFNNIRTIYCEGDLAYLVDSVQKAEKYEGTAHQLFQNIIAAHNARVEAAKQFTVGNITVENRSVILTGQSDDITDAETGNFDYKQIAINSIADEWQNSYDFIQSCLIDYTGGYLRTRRQNGVTYIDLLANYGRTATQEIEFGKNLLDLTQEVNAEDVFTVLIPLGDENLTIESVNGGSDELVDATAVAKYGRIVKTHVFDSVTNATTLLENAQRYLANNVNVPVTVTVKAVDMHMVDENVTPIYVGDVVRVTSVPHDQSGTLTCTKIEYDLENAANNTYTFGTPKQSLTERYRKDKEDDESEKSHGGGGGGSDAEAASDAADEKLSEFFDAWINVDEETGNIDLGTVYKKLNDTVTTLESTCGISMDAPSGNINIKTLRKEFDDLGTTVDEQSAYIDLLNDDLNTKISLITAKHETLDDREEEHYTGIVTSIADHESRIASNTETIQTLNSQVSTSTTNITQLSSALQAQITLEAEHKESLEGKIATNTASINTLSDDLQAQITLEAKHNSDQASTIASISAKADANESSITLKADKTTVNSKITTINGRLDAAEANISTLQADYASIDELISKKINSITLDTLIAKATIIHASFSIISDVLVKGKSVVATDTMTLGGKAVATKEYVDGKISGEYATQDWVTSQGYLTAIPNSCSASVGFYAPYIRATTAMSVGGKTVATQEWVTSQLASYSKTDHTHAYSAITGKPSTFTPASHTHSFSGSYSLAWGHTHTYSIGNTYTGGVRNYAAKTISIFGTTGKN